MSRHEVPGKNPNHEVVVGWDPPLETYFFIVYDKEKKGTDDAVLVWQGTSPREMYGIEYLRACLRPHAVLPIEVANSLYLDKDEDR